MVERGELDEQIRVLRARVAQLEAAQNGRDPLLLAMAEHARQLVHVVDLDGRILATGSVPGAAGAVVGRSVYDFLEPESHEVARAAYERALETRQPVVHESVGYGEDGAPGRTYLTRVIPFLQGGKVTAFLVAPTDITERVQLERSLAEEAEALRLAVQASGLGLWRWDVITGTMTWDERMKQIWGVQSTPRDYESYLTLLHPEDRDEVDRHVRSALETGVYETFEHRLRPDDHGRVRWLLAAGNVIKNRRGEVACIMGGVLEITEQRRLAAQQQRAARVEALGQLTAGIAHNFNNLLAVIVPNAELLLCSATEKQQKQVSALLDASLQARDLVRSLMALTRRDPPQSQASCNVVDVVERVVSICRATFPREIALHCDVASDSGHVAMDSGSLEQVLLNLLFNARDAVEAIDAFDSALREVTIRTGHTDGTVTLVVQDTGVGMSEETKAHLFEPFFTTKPPHKGSGLGLATVLDRITATGGRIICRSRLREGTTFQVELPAAAAPPRPLRGPSLPAADSDSARLLLVDDEPLVRSALRGLLEMEGYVVAEAESAQAARKHLHRHAVDLIILDQSMPVETGLDAVDSLRALSSAPIVLYTGMAPEASLPVEAVLEKPARPAELRRVVRKVLDAHRAALSLAKH